jgi:hypothetical protein
MKSASMSCMAVLLVFACGCAGKVGYTVRNETKYPIRVVIGQLQDPRTDSDHVASASVARGERLNYGGDSRSFRRTPNIFISVEGSRDDPIEFAAPMRGGWFYRVQESSGVVYVTTQKVLPHRSE